MIKKTISYKSTNILIEKLKKQSDIEVIKEGNFFSKIFSKKKYADVYFHTGNLDEKSIENIKNAKMTIVNSFASMNEIIAKTKISHEKVKVIYPSIDIQYKNPEDIKIRICEELKIDFHSKLIFFTAKNFKSSGVKEVLDICASLSFQNFKIIIAGEQKQIYSLKFQLTKYQKLEDKIILIEDYLKIDDLFLASDIFLLPTYNKGFSTNILKAMFCESVVFLSIENDAKEIVDVFSSMSSPIDPSTAFKIDAILLNENDLINIKKQNRELASEFTLEANLLKINSILENV
ncbi:MAG TPA: glycosyltransferase [Aliarcobacter cryaerophilus]|jgi:glycosyltransferase involved in cell wall biosynthesis|nr:glycosyltransferase [Aliarcobacter cryaerophilus]